MKLDRSVVMEFTELKPAHDDQIHDIAFDYCGKRFATCSSDKQIKIWNLNDKNQWIYTDIRY